MGLGGALTNLSARWCCVLTALLFAAPLLSARAIGEESDPNRRLVSDLTPAVSPAASSKPAPLAFGTSFHVIARSQPAPPLSTAPRATARPVPPPPPTPAPTPPPTPAPLPAVQPPTAPTGFCCDALSVHVVNPELVGAVQAGIDLLTPHFGCQKFRMDGAGVPVKFGPITPLFSAKVMGYAHSTPDTYEIWINPDCWGVVEDWSTVVAHELGHYLGWQHGDDHPYMWLAPPPGSYAQDSDLAIVCY